ncbi:hypothetical protein BaRGS_00038556 [Batillaria attramentaria]|uniref:VCBS repeat-containing protein n=1 Tax=Batillaria attramentaria TaxID=370345 RepID=A0ABD0J5B6_9CAEN
MEYSRCQQISKIVLLSCFVFTFLNTCQAQTLVEVGRITAPHAAYVALVENSNALDRMDKYTVMISGFNPLPFQHDCVYEVDGVGKNLRDNVSMSAREISRDITWPNEIDEVPEAVFDQSGLVSVAGGFLVPFKNHGSLTLFDMTVAPPVKHVLTDSTAASWFYHRVEWRDMNGDGLLDIVTCRAKSHLFGSTEGELVWFEHPQQGALTSTISQHLLDNKPRQPLGQPCHVADLNGDGNLDLLVTNNALSHASLFAYTIPADFRSDSFPRRTLSTGYASRTSGQGRGAPGSPIIVYPETQVTTGKPWIILSGDDDGQAHLLKPASNDASDWSYQQTNFLDVGTGTVGGIAAGDMDGDGWTEVFVPSFDEGEVHVFSFRPAPSAPIG